MTADQTASFIVIRVCNLILFDRERRRFWIIQAGRGAARRDAEKEPGKIRVVGHTDNTPINSARFPSNFDFRWSAPRLSPRS